MLDIRRTQFQWKSIDRIIHPSVISAGLLIKTTTRKNCVLRSFTYWMAANNHKKPTLILQLNHLKNSNMITHIYDLN